MSSEGDKPTTTKSPGAGAEAPVAAAAPGARKKKKKGGGKRRGGGAAAKSGGGAPTTAGRAAPNAPAYPWWIAAVIGMALTALTVWAWPPRPAPEPHVQRGNSEYAQRRYREALGEYESAPGAGPRNAGVQLDRGLARFRVAVPTDASTLPLLAPDAAAPEGLARAQDELRTAARGGTTNAAEDVDAFLRARAAYNLANTLFAQRAWDNAIDAFKEALRLRPGWREAAWNLELARRLREAERNPPDAGPDASADASQQPDSGPPDAGPQDGSPNQNDGGNNQGDGGSNRGDGGSQGQDGGANRGDAGQQPQGQDGGANGNEPDAGPPPPPPDGGPPRSMAPLDSLDRTSRSLQNEIMRRRGIVPRGPDDDR